MSNGPVAVEYMADALGLPLIDLAFAGASTGSTNVLGVGLPGMLQEFAGGPPVDFAAAVPTAVPEPSSVLLVLAGLAEAVRRRAVRVRR